MRDADNTPFVILTTDLTTDSRQFSEEVQLQLDCDKVSAIVGGYYFNEATDERASVPLSFPPAPPIIASILAGGPGSRDLQFSDLETELAGRVRPGVVQAGSTGSSWPLACATPMIARPTRARS